MTENLKQNSMRIKTLKGVLLFITYRQTKRLPTLGALFLDARPEPYFSSETVSPSGPKRI